MFLSKKLSEKPIGGPHDMSFQSRSEADLLVSRATSSIFFFRSESRLSVYRSIHSPDHSPLIIPKLTVVAYYSVSRSIHSPGHSFQKFAVVEYYSISIGLLVCLCTFSFFEPSFLLKYVVSLSTYEDLPVPLSFAPPLLF